MKRITSKFGIQNLLLLSSMFAMLVTSSIAHAEVLFFSNDDAVPESSNSIILDGDDSGGTTQITFGNTIQAYLKNDGTLFYFSDDLRMESASAVQFRDSAIAINSSVDGQLDIDSDGEVEIDTSLVDINSAVDISGTLSATSYIDLSGASGMQIREDSDPATNAACSAVGELIYDTTDNKLQYCTTPGAAGAATWSNVDSGGDGHMQNTDTGTTENTFTLDSDNTGGNVDLVFGNTVAQYLRHDGTLFHFSDDLLMDGADALQLRDSALSINSSADGQLDIDADVEVEITAPALDVNGNIDATGLTSSGQVDFSSSSGFQVREDSDPATNAACANVGELIFNTTNNQLQHCTVPGPAGASTWVDVSEGTGLGYTYAYDTTVQKIDDTNTWQPVIMDTNVFISGWNHTAGTATFTATLGGLYQVTYNASVAKTSNGSGLIELRGNYDGAEVPGSQGSTKAYNRYATDMIGGSFLINVTAGQVFKMELAGDNKNLALYPRGTGAASIRPSIKLTMVKIN